MRREIVLYSVVLAIALGLAYKTSTKNESVKESDIPVLALNAETLVAVHYKDNEHLVDATRIGDGERYRLSYQVIKKEAPLKSDAKALDPHEEHASEQAGQETADGESEEGDEGPEVAPNPATTEQKPETFAAGKNFNTMLTGLNPMQASRVFESVSDEKLKEFGLKDNAAELVFERKNAEPVKLWVGQKNFGSEARFVRVDGDKKNRVYVVDGDFIGSLKKARARIFEKDLLTQPMQEYASVQVKVGEKIRNLRPDKDAAGTLKEWLDEEGAHQSASVSYKNWLEKLEKVNITDYTERPLAELGQPLMIVVFQAKNAAAERIDFYSETKAGAPGQQEKTSYFAFVHSTQSLVVVPAARFISVEKDAEKIFPKS